MTPFDTAVAETARRALLRVVSSAIRQIEELELDPAKRWTLLKQALDGLSTPTRKEPQ